ncbi:MAG: transposase [Coleofasciculus sp. A1-SPW-01]|uniref:RNA-guided endonuclease InsQ/TnpB family protein n=1 Tax=Coleofasciculus sp. A1-SPW-01 TaxID=3070819 RepID=UPI0032F8A201
MHDLHLIVEEPCERKLSRTVLKTRGTGDSLAEFNNSLPAFKEVWTEYKECNSMTLQATLKRVDYAFNRWFKGLAKRPKYKSIKHYSGWTYPSKTGWKVHTTGDNGYAPKFLRKAEAKIKRLSKGKRRKRPPNRRKKQKASNRWKKTQAKISKVTRKVANQRQNWVHQVATDIVSCNSFVATEKLEVSKMTRSSKKGKRKKQKAGLNKSILDVGMGMLRSAIEYKVKNAGGVFVEVPTRKVKPSQTCPKCGNQAKKTLDERVHHCHECGLEMDRDLAAALVMLLWALGILPGFGTSLADADVSSSTSETCKRKQTGSMKQLGQVKRQKHSHTGLVVETQTSTK